VPFLLSSRSNLLFTNSSFSGRKKIFKTKSCKNIAANLPDLKKTRQSFPPPKISPSRIARSQNLKKHLVKKEGRGGGDKSKKASHQQRLVTKTRHYYGLANTTKNQHHHSCISDCKIAQEKELGFHEAQLLKKELRHHSYISNCKITEENMHKNVHEKHMRRHMMETFCMNFWKKKKKPLQK
jgi:hypothetical protein